MTSGDTLAIIQAILGTVFVILLTYYGSRFYVNYLAKKQGGITKGSHIKVVERLIVSKTGAILIIDVQGIQYMVGVSEQNIQIMKELEEPISLQNDQEIAKESFFSVFKTFTQKEKEHEKNKKDH